MRVKCAILAGSAMLCLLAAAPVAADKGGLRYTVAVTQFDNEAGWTGQWSIGNAWGTVLTDLLNDSGRFIVLGEQDMRYEALNEQDFAASGRTAGGSKAPETGQMTPAQILVKGAITHVQYDAGSGSGGVRISGFRIGGGGSKAEVNVTIYMVDSTTGMVVASESVVGTAGRRGLDVAYSEYDWGAAFGGEKVDNLGLAVADAAEQAVEFMIGELPSVAWRGTVVQVQGSKVFINRGTREGVSSGQQFIVGETSVIRDPDTGEVLDESVSELARLSCSQVKEKLSICDVTSGNAGAIQRGQGVMSL